MIRVVKWVSLGAVLLFVLLVVGLWRIAPAPLQRDLPRDLPWELPDYRLAATSWELGAQGQIHTRVEHFFLKGISPAMVAWFYQQLPISTVEYRGVTYPLYHIFHPTEHGTIRVLEAAPDGTPGMATGALIERIEWFGPYDSSGAARIQNLSSEGLLAVPEIAGLAMGEVRHSLAAEDGGTTYRVDAVIGSDLPVLGPMLNYYLRKRVFHPKMLEQWQRHQIEEVASLQFFLPKIYSQRGEDNHFILDSLDGS